ncbi:MAG: 2-oxoglutarate dehydrogenase component [Armatimonadetes bacterium]|jgi:2-oxoglutarate dehydrogenase E2 component (dihydrolipoamide succinyltransferase)|nr:2-oxoglutarate dehydrogenase component [Armatimonadota bacterium]
MATEIRVPAMGESVVEATVGSWLKQVGDPVSVGEILVELETDKVNQQLSAAEAGVLEQIVHGVGDVVRVGDLLGSIGAGNGAAAAGDTAAPAAETPAAPAPETDGNGQRVVATPMAQRMAEDLNVDLSKVPNTGPGGRVTKDDVEAFARQAPAPTPAAPTPTATASAPPPTQPGIGARAVAPVQPATAAPAATGARGETRKRLTRRRATIARRLVEAQQTAAMLTTFNEIDLTAVMDIRKRRKDAFKEQHGVNLGFMSFFTKASIGALKAFPEINSELQGDELVLKEYYDIGVAIGDPEGLVVPVLRNAERMSFAEIEKAIGNFAKQSREKTLSPEDLRGGTFTITNGGVYGSLLSTPILNPPQVGILGMHKIQERPVAVNGEVVIRPMMYVALTYDHRVVDGRGAVQFLVRIKELLEDPLNLLLEG